MIYVIKPLATIVLEILACYVGLRNFMIYENKNFLILFYFSFFEVK